jgi:pilus assembly protein CpaE
MTILCEPLRRHAEQLGMLLGNGLRTVTTLDELTAALYADRDEHLALLGPGIDLADALRFAAEQRIERPALGVVLLRNYVDVEVLGEAIRAGVREVAEAGDAAAVLGACSRSLALSNQLSGGPAPAGMPQADGQVVTVFAAKGGCGKTTIATNLAVALAAGGTRRVCVVDLDLAFGDVAIMLQLVPDRSVSDAVSMADRLDETGFRSLLTPYTPGVEALLAPSGPADGEHVTRQLVGELLRLARGAFDFVVVDTPPQFTDHVLAALDTSHKYVLVATPDIPALKNLRITLDMFDLLDYPTDARLVVLNRADAKVGLTPADIERVIRVPIAARIPSSRDVPISVNKGVPIMTDSPGHAVSKSLREFALSQLVTADPAQARARRGLLARRRAAVAR